MYSTVIVESLTSTSISKGQTSSQYSHTNKSLHHPSCSCHSAPLLYKLREIPADMRDGKPSADDACAHGERGGGRLATTLPWTRASTSWPWRCQSWRSKPRFLAGLASAEWLSKETMLSASPSRRGAVP